MSDDGGARSIGVVGVPVRSCLGHELARATHHLFAPRDGVGATVRFDSCS